MQLHTNAQFGQALRTTLESAGYKQTVLAALLRVNPSTVSRWINGATRPSARQVDAIDKLLGSRLSEGGMPLKPRIEVFVSSPMLGLDVSSFTRHERQVRKVVSKIREHGPSVYWPGENIATEQDFTAADLATEEGLRTLYGSSALLFIQFEDMRKSSSALIEVGIALGLGKSVTMIIGDLVVLPYMLSQGFEGVAGRLPFTPNVRIYRVSSADDACALVERNGLSLFGL